MRARIIGLLALFFGATGLSAPGREFLKALFWDRVIHHMDPILAIPIGYVLDYGLPSAVVAFGLYLLAGEQKRHNALHWVSRLNTFLLIAVIAAVISFGAFTAYLIDRSRGPLIWTWDDWWIGWAKNPDGPLQMIGFQISAKNRWDDPIKIDKAYVRSDISGAEIPLTLQIKRQHGYADSTIPVIPAEQEFKLVSRIKQGDNPRATEFRAEFGRMTVFFNSAIVKRFSPAEIDNYIARAEAQANKDLNR